MHAHGRRARQVDSQFAAQLGGLGIQIVDHFHMVGEKSDGREHDVGNAGPETIDAPYIAKRLSDDWGFYYTCTTNLKKVNDKLATYQELKQEDREDVSKKIEKLLKIIEDEPKTMRWKLRARMGPSKKWYRDVEEVRR